jgi:hypothetical protein
MHEVKARQTTRHQFGTPERTLQQELALDPKLIVGWACTISLDCRALHPVAKHCLGVIICRFRPI